MTRCLLLIPLFWLACKKKPEIPPRPRGAVSAQQLDAFTRVQYGTMPLVISVPHGGTLTPDSLPDRTCPNSTTAVDLLTLEMAAAIDSLAFADYGVRPYLVTTTLRRIKLDQNRPLAEATCSNAAVYSYWYRFHDAIDTCLQRALKQYPQCLYIDLHAHGHVQQRLELGYLMDAGELQNSASVPPANTSLWRLFAMKPSLTVGGLLTGPYAFGTLMQAEGYPSVPSAAIPHPGNDPYFNGGYNTAIYAVKPYIAGWQIESNYTGVRENRAQRTAFAQAFLRSLMTYYRHNTVLDPGGFGY